MIFEKYTHTRNYGCRIRRYNYNEVDMLSMENSKIKVVIALGKGADIVELMYKPLDIDMMWHSFNELGKAGHLTTVASSSGNFLDSYSGGWQDLFPTYGGRSLYNGAEIGVHGEACLYPWNVKIIRDDPTNVEVCLTLRTLRSPFLLSKTLSLTEDETSLTISESITNEGTSQQSFMWGQHPAFGVPFLDESVRLHISGTPTVTVPASVIAHHCPFNKETTGRWPFLPSMEGKMIDMSRAYSPEDRLYMEYYLSGLTEGKYEIVNHNMNLGLRMSWDKNIFPYLWVWGMYCGIDQYPWYGRAYVMAVEPWSSMPGDYAGARKAETLLSLAAGETLNSKFKAEIITI